MGYLSEYLTRNMTFEQIAAERKQQLQTVSQRRGGRDVLVYAARMAQQTPGLPIVLEYSDLAAINDQLALLSGKRIDVIIETPGGSAEVADDVVRQLYSKYDEVSFIIPGWAKSAGTIMAMAGNEILMGRGSALGPIDAQMPWQDRFFSADAFLEGFDKIKSESVSGLNRAYVPILQSISPGDLQAAENAMKFATTLVREWLTSHKFRDWTVHSSSGAPVTSRQRRLRAGRIARKLCDHKTWLTHGRSLKIADLEGIGLRITNYDDEPLLSEAIGRYHALLQLTFQTTLARNIYKVIETIPSQIYRQVVAAGAGAPGLTPQQATSANLETQCPNCGHRARLQANLDNPQPLLPGSLPFPADAKFTCPTCGTVQDLEAVKRQVEAQTGKKVVG